MSFYVIKKSTKPKSVNQHDPNRHFYNGGDREKDRNRDQYKY